MTNCDALMQDLLNTYGIPGGQLALSRQGKLVYDRAFGHADLSGNEATQPHHLFRVASVSKPVTGVAMMKLLESGQVQLSDHVFGPGGLLASHPYLSTVQYTDVRLNDITIDHLLHHTAGWDRTLDCFPDPTTPYAWQMPGCDPISAPLHVTQVLGESNPVSKHALVRFLIEHGLDHDPGSTFAYSNIGYLVLGEVIATVSGMSYEDYLRAEVLDPLGICDAHLGRNLLAEKLEREAEYEGEGYLAPSCYGTGSNVPWEYGGWNLEAMDAHGGWVFSARELVKLLVAVDGFSTKPDILNAATLATMAADNAVSQGYACGWQTNSADNWWHTGALDGTASMIVRSWNGYTWALLLNKRLTNGQANAFWADVDAMGWNCIGGTSSWPSHDLMAMPLSNASALSAVPVGVTGATIQCVGGDGDGRIMVVRAGNAPQRFPLDGTNYNPNSAWSLGDDLGDGNYVVSAGSATGVAVTGLAAGGNYVVSAYEYTSNAGTGQHTLYKLCGRSDVQLSMPVDVAEFSSDAGMRVAVRDGQLVLLEASPQPGQTLQLIDAMGRTVRSVKVAGSMALHGVASGPYLVVLLHNEVTTGIGRVVVP